MLQCGSMATGFRQCMRQQCREGAAWASGVHALTAVGPGGGTPSRRDAEQKYGLVESTHLYQLPKSADKACLLAYLYATQLTKLTCSSHWISLLFILEQLVLVLVRGSSGRPLIFNWWAHMHVSAGM